MAPLKKPGMYLGNRLSFLLDFRVPFIEDTTFKKHNSCKKFQNQSISMMLFFILTRFCCCWWWWWCRSMRCCIGAQHIFKRNRFWAKHFNVRFPHSTKYSSQIGINIWRWDGHMYMCQCSKYLCMYHSRLIIGEKCNK